MNDRDYLNRLMKRFEKAGIQFSSNFKESLHDPSFQMNRLHQHIIDEAKQMMPYVAERSKIRKDVLERRLSNIRMVMQPDVNGFVTSSDDWETFEIGINYGLMIFFHKIITLFSSRSCLTSIWGNGRPIDYPKQQIESIIPLARGLMQAFWQGTVLDAPWLHIGELNNNQIGIWSALLTRAERFVIGHEFGHIVIRISPTKASEFDLGIELCKAFVTSKISKMNEHEKNLLERGWGEEIAADLIGLELSLYLANDHNTRIFTYSAIELVFIMNKMLESFYKKIMGTDPPLDIHPPSSLRLNCMRTIVEAYNPNLLEIGGARGYEIIADKILSKV